MTEVHPESYIFRDVHSSTTPNSPELFIHREMNKFHLIHTEEYYTAMQKDELQLHRTQKNLTDITLSERRQTPQNAC